MLGKIIPKGAYWGAAAKVGMFVIIETRRAWFGCLARRRGRLGMGRGRRVRVLGSDGPSRAKKALKSRPPSSKRPAMPQARLIYTDLPLGRFAGCARRLRHV